MSTGAQHFANMSDPQIPAATGAGGGRRHFPAQLPPQGSTDTRRLPGIPQYTFTNTNGTFHGLVPGDIATIYNLTPLFAAGYTGKGQTIMVVEDTYLYSTGDWTVFRKTFGLTRPYPSAL